MESALMIVPPRCSASLRAKADLPLAVGPAMRMMLGTSNVLSAARIARHVLCGNADFGSGPPRGDRRPGAAGRALFAAWPAGRLAGAGRGGRYRLPGRGGRARRSA